jgi:hypothetical protein
MSFDLLQTDIPIISLILIGQFRDALFGCSNGILIGPGFPDSLITRGKQFNKWFKKEQCGGHVKEVRRASAFQMSVTKAEVVGEEEVDGGPGRFLAEDPNWSHTSTGMRGRRTNYSISPLLRRLRWGNTGGVSA